MGALLAAFAVLFLASAASAASEIESSSAHNFALAGALLGSDNACGLAERTPTADDIFSVASIAAVALLPMADNRTSDLSSPKLLWGWSAKSPRSAQFEVAPDDGCQPGRLELYAPSEKRLEGGKLEYAYGNRRMAVGLEPGGPNPVGLDLNESHLREEDFVGLFANLSVNVSGKASVTYSYGKFWQERVCTDYGDYVGCGCETRSEFGLKAFEKPVKSSRTFFVEVGKNEVLWLNPPLQNRLAENQQGKLLIFARRMPAKISVNADGREIAAGKMYGFAVSEGSCGEKIVQSKFFPESLNAFANASTEPVSPTQLVEKNASYLPHYFEFGWDESPGRKNITVFYEDWFSNAANESREFFARRPEGFFGDAAPGAMALREGDARRTPAAYPAKESSGQAIGASFLAAVFAIPFAFAAIGILRWLRKFSP